MECARRQGKRCESQPKKVAEAVQLRARLGVIQREEEDHRIGKVVTRLYRTDSARPTYPGSPLTLASS